jgi:threonine/homoserine/homoserine lactone efflux protein
MMVNGSFIPRAYHNVQNRSKFERTVSSNVLNPKTVVFYLAFMPQFIGPEDPVLQKSLLLAGIHYAEGILWLVGVSMTVEQTRRLFLQVKVRRWLDGICGTLFVGFGVRLALERQ